MPTAFNGSKIGILTTNILFNILHYRKLLNGLARLNIDLIILAQNRRYEN